MPEDKQEVPQPSNPEVSPESTKAPEAPQESRPEVDEPTPPAETNAPITPAPTSQEEITLEKVANHLAPASGTITLVWQWLTYGLWFWTLGALSVLLSATLAYFIGTSDSDDTTWMVYIIATTLCLLPVAFFIDRIYSKQEPDHKQGFSAVILVIHAVVAFLVSMGALITAVVTLLSLATDIEGDNETQLTVIASALTIAALSALFFVRILRPAKLRGLTKRFGLIVSVVAAITVIGAIAGPYVTTITTKNDRKIESGLYDVNSSIQDYADENKKLPDSLNDLSFDSYYDNAEDLVKDGLVDYRKLSSAEASTLPSTLRLGSTDQKLSYELCVTYKKEKGDGEIPSSSSTYSSSYIDTSSHPAGRTCYKQVATVYSSSYQSLYD